MAIFVFIADDKLPTKVIAIGLSISVVSCAFASFGNVCIRRDAIQQNFGDSESIQPIVLRHRLVILALACYIFGAILDFLSLGYMTMSIRACTSGFTVVGNAVMSYAFLGEKLTKSQGIGVITIVAGAMCAMAFGSLQYDAGKSADQLLELATKPRLLFFVICTFPLYLVGITQTKAELSCQSRGNECESPNILLEPLEPWEDIYESEDSSSLNSSFVLFRARLLCCICYVTAYQACITNLLGKVLSELLDHHEPDFCGVVICLSLVLVSAILQLTFMQWMMRLFDASVCIPPYQIILMLLMISFGAVYFGEMPSNAIGFAIALACSVVGIIIVALNVDETIHVRPLAATAAQALPSDVSCLVGLSPRVTIDSLVNTPRTSRIVSRVNSGVESS